MKKLFFILLIWALPAFASDSYRIKLPNGLTINAEVAKDKQKGLMNRTRLCRTCGMIFIYEKEGYYQFWMKDTLINLAMLWIDSKGTIVHIEKNAVPCLEKENPYNDCPLYSPTAPAKYVLEVSPEAVKDVKVGMKVKNVSSTLP